MKKRRFPNWIPKVGERALVPGTPANAQYIDELDQDDVDVIEAGHRGYTPLRVKLFDQDNKCLDVLLYNERRGHWESDCGGWGKNLGVIKRGANQRWGKKRGLYFDA